MHQDFWPTCHGNSGKKEKFYTLQTQIFKKVFKLTFCMVIFKQIKGVTDQRQQVIHSRCYISLPNSGKCTCTTNAHGFDTDDTAKEVLKIKWDKCSKWVNSN